MGPLWLECSAALTKARDALTVRSRQPLPVSTATARAHEVRIQCVQHRVISWASTRGCAWSLAEDSASSFNDAKGHGATKSAEAIILVQEWCLQQDANRSFIVCSPSIDPSRLVHCGCTRRDKDNIRPPSAWRHGLAASIPGIKRGVKSNSSPGLISGTADDRSVPSYTFFRVSGHAIEGSSILSLCSHLQEQGELDGADGPVANLFGEKSGPFSNLLIVEKLCSRSRLQMVPPKRDNPLRVRKLERVHTEITQGQYPPVRFLSRRNALAVG